jgi:hypothetical protein
MLKFAFSPTRGEKLPAARSAQRNTPLFPHPPPPCHTHPAPAAGWIANVSVQAGGRPSEAVVTCGRWREEAVHRHCSAGRCLVPPGRAPEQPPEKSLPSVPASAGRQPGWGWKRACGGPSCGYGKGHGAHAPRPGAPASSTRRPSPCRRMPQAVEAARVRAANKRHATACRTWTPSGETRARARVAPPRACASHAHPYQPSSEASARARPSGPDFPFQTPALSRAGAPAAAIP